jgi:hypothetical protein
MRSRREAWESITTRRILRPPELGLSPPACADVGCFAAFGFAAVFGGAAAAAGLDFASAFRAPSPPSTRALAATSSSTLDAAAFTSTPAALSAAITSLLVRPLALAIS